MTGPSTACPRCGQSLALAHLDALGMLTCTCGFTTYAGYLQEFEYVSRRRQWLWDRVVEQAGPPDPATARQYGVWPATTPAPPAPPVHKGAPTQILLVALGAGLLILAGVVFVAVAWDLIGVYGQLLMMLLVTVLTGAAAWFTRLRTPRTAEALAVVSFALAVILMVAAPSLGLVPESWAEPDRPYWLLASAALMGGGLGLGALSGLRAWSALGWLSAPFVLAAAFGIGSGWIDSGHLEMTVAAVAFLALALALFTGHPGAARVVSAALSLLVTGTLTLAMLPMTPPVGAIVTIAAALLALLLLSRRFAGVEFIGWPLFALWVTLLVGLAPSSPLTSVVAAILGAGLMVALSPRSVLLAVASGWTLWTSWMMSAPEDAWLVLVVAGLAQFGLATRRNAAPVAWVGAVSVEAALLLEWDSTPVFEGPTAALALLLLAAGLLQRRAGERRSSIVYGPAVTMALVPSALMVWVDVWSQPSLIRFGIVMAGGILLLLVGVKRRMLGLVVPSTIAVSIAATAQIFATLDLFPRWLALGIAGAILLLVGARIEWVRSKREETSAWLHSLQ